MRFAGWALRMERLGDSAAACANVAAVADFKAPCARRRGQIIERPADSRGGILEPWQPVCAIDGRRRCRLATGLLAPPPRRPGRPLLLSRQKNGGNAKPLPPGSISRFKCEDHWIVICFGFCFDTSVFGM